MYKIASVFFLSSDRTLAQSGMMRWRGSEGWGQGSQYSRMYNPQTIESISGKIVSIERSLPMPKMSQGVHLTVQTGKETMPVHLGPEWYITDRDMQLQVNERVEIKGSKVNFDGKPTIIAAVVKKGDKVLTLRDNNGFPLWSGCCLQR
ncbi:MAG: DNA-binding protein [Xenococcaceae cyanobacterium]